MIKINKEIKQISKNKSAQLFTPIKGENWSIHTFFQDTYAKLLVGDDSQGRPFQLLLHRGVGEGATPFPGLLHFTLDTYLILLSVKQGGIKYHFWSLWYDATWNWTQVSWAIGEHSINKANEPVLQTISSWIWTLITDSISNENNRYFNLSM